MFVEEIQVQGQAQNLAAAHVHCITAKNQYTAKWMSNERK